LLIGLFAFTTSCSDDDDSVEEIIEGVVEDGEEIIEGVVEEGGEVIDGVVEEGIVNENGERLTVVINEVSYGENDWVEIFNPTGEAVDIAGLWLCAGPTRYHLISSNDILVQLNNDSGTLLGSGEFIAIGIGDIVLSDSEGFALYNNDNGDRPNFSDSEFIIDFVQFGESGSARENVAVEAGLWMEGTSIDVSSSTTNTINYNGSGLGVDSWSLTTQATPGLGNLSEAP